MPKTKNPKIKIEGYGIGNWRIWIDGKRVENLISIEFYAEAKNKPALVIKRFCPILERITLENIDLV